MKPRSGLLERGFAFWSLRSGAYCAAILRWLKEHRRIGWLVALGAAVLVLTCVLAWTWWLPAVARARAVAALEDRTGLDARVGTIDLGWDGPRMDDVELRGRGEGIVVRIEHVDVRAGMWALAWRGTAAIRGIRAHDVRIAIDLTADGVRASLRRFRRAVFGAQETSASRGSTEDASSTSHPDAASSASSMSVSSRRYEAAPLEIAIDDRHGKLLRLSGRARRTGGGVELTAERITLGGAPTTAASLRGVRARLEPSEHGWRLQQASLTQGAIVLPERTGPPRSNRSDRAPSLRARLGALRGGADSAGRGSALDAKAATTRRDAGHDANSRDAGRNAARRHAHSDVPDRDGGVANPDSGEPSVPSGLEQRVARFAPDVAVQVDRLAVRTRAEGRTETVLDDLQASIEGRGHGVFHTAGSGHTGAGGAIEWRLEIEPLRAELQGTLSFEQVPLALVAPLLPTVPWHRPERARLAGELVVEAKSASRFAVDGNVALTNAALSSDRIAAEPVEGISLSLEGEGVWMPLRHRMRIDSARVSMGAASVELKGALEWAPDHYMFDLTADLPSTRCGKVIGALPQDLLGELSGFEWKGVLAGHASLRVDSRELEATELTLQVTDRCDFARVPAMAEVARFEGAFVHRVEEPDDTIFEMTTGPGTANWVPIAEVSPYLVHAVLAHEDASFFSHHGFAPWAIQKALVRNLKKGGFVLGASTINMQLAKNLFLSRDKKLARKLKEVVLAWWLERALDKASILELYLNVIEYGPSIYGIQRAAKHYFGRHPSELSAAESAFIACILPSPKSYHELYEERTLSRSMRNRIRRLLEHMLEKERIDQAAFDHAVTQLETFSFHPDGAPPPPPRDVMTLPGSPASLPEGVADSVPSTPGEPESLQPPIDPYETFQQLPDVDPGGRLGEGG